MSGFGVGSANPFARRRPPRCAPALRGTSPVAPAGSRRLARGRPDTAETDATHLGKEDSMTKLVQTQHTTQQVPGGEMTRKRKRKQERQVTTSWVCKILLDVIRFHSSPKQALQSQPSNNSFPMRFAPCRLVDHVVLHCSTWLISRLCTMQLQVGMLVGMLLEPTFNTTVTCYDQNHSPGFTPKARRTSVASVT